MMMWRQPEPCGGPYWYRNLGSHEDERKKAEEELRFLDDEPRGSDVCHECSDTVTITLTLLMLPLQRSMPMPMPSRSYPPHTSVYLPIRSHDSRVPHQALHQDDRTSPRRI